MSKAQGIAQSANQGQFKNRIINGAMMIDQRNAGASINLDGNSKFPIDRFKVFGRVAGGATGQRSSVAPAGFSNSFLYTVTTGATPGGGDYPCIQHCVEGFNVADLGWGTANAQPITISFWVRSSVTGTYAFSMRNSSSTRSYVAQYTINSANTWEQKSITISGDTTGTWLNDNSIGIELMWDMGFGFGNTTTPNSWLAGNSYRVSSNVNLVATTGATFYITGVQLEKGSTATSFDYRPYGTEDMLCKRYYWKIAGDNGDYPAIGSGVVQSSTSARIYIKHPVSMRTYPTFSYGGTLNIDHGGFFQTPVTSISGAYEGLDTSMLDLGASGGGLTAGRGAIVYCNNASTNFLQASAEL